MEIILKILLWLLLMPVILLIGFFLFLLISFLFSLIFFRKKFIVIKWKQSSETKKHKIHQKILDAEWSEKKD